MNAEKARLRSIGVWTEDKLNILREYAAAYSVIMARAKGKVPFRHVYIDAFAGEGMYLSRKTRELVAGSPLNALQVQPPFDEYYFIDIDPQHIDALRRMAGERPNVHYFADDANDVLLTEVFPNVQYANYMRGLCFVDPYGIHLDWRVIAEAGQMRSIELFINFSIMDINRNVLRKDTAPVRQEDIERMDRFCGDHSWDDSLKDRQRGFWGDISEKKSNEAVASWYRSRLSDVAGFRHVPKPIPMYNRSGTTVYYLFFASHNEVGAKIAQDIFRKYAKSR